MSYRIIPYAIAAFCAILIGLLFWIDIREKHQWEAWRDLHHCKVEGTIDSSTGEGYGPNGQYVVTSIPGKVLWRCDDGLIHGVDE